MLSVRLGGLGAELFPYMLTSLKYLKLDWQFMFREGRQKQNCCHQTPVKPNQIVAALGMGFSDNSLIL